MENLQFFDNQNTPVLVLNTDREIKYFNNSFKVIFGKIKNIEHFASHFFFDICLLNPDNIQNHNPIKFALNSKENFFTQTTYQIDKNKFLSFDLNSFTQNNFVVLTFVETTAQNKYKTLLDNFNNLKKDYQELLTENKKYSEIQQKAQSQAIKMALLNRFTNTIRESVDNAKIIKSALKELCTLFGGFKAYFASSQDLKYKIQYIYPNTYNKEINKLISFDKSINREIASKHHHISHCIKEHNESTENFKMSTDRIVIPVYHQSSLLGILVVLSYQDINLIHDDDIIKSISTQLANTMVQATLFEQINTQNIKLEETLKELKETQLHLINAEKMASLGQLVAGVAHEINTPLASINSNNLITSKLIKQLQVIENPNEIIETLNEIHELDKEAIKRISKIVLSLKQFVRLDEAEVQKTDINRELDLTLDLIRHETKNKVTIEKNYGDIPQINCYPNMLNQVFMNILVNAVQSIETQGKIIITTSKENNNLSIKIQDNGCGIKEENKHKIFTAGFTSKGVGVGTGLGLAISKKIVEKHNGTIAFKSEHNKGTEFTILIPY